MEEALDLSSDRIVNERMNERMNIHFINHLAKTWLSERPSSRERDFIFKEENFQLSIHYLYLTNNIYKDKTLKN